MRWCNGYGFSSSSALCASSFYFLHIMSNFRCSTWLDISSPYLIIIIIVVVSMRLPAVDETRRTYLHEKYCPGNSWNTSHDCTRRSAYGDGAREKGDRARRRESILKITISAAAQLSASFSQPFHPSRKHNGAAGFRATSLLALLSFLPSSSSISLSAFARRISLYARPLSLAGLRCRGCWLRLFPFFAMFPSPVMVLTSVGIRKILFRSPRACCAKLFPSVCVSLLYRRRREAEEGERDPSISINLNSRRRAASVPWARELFRSSLHQRHGGRRGHPCDVSSFAQGIYTGRIRGVKVNRRIDKITMSRSGFRCQPSKSGFLYIAVTFLFSLDARWNISRTRGVALTDCLDFSYDIKWKLLFCILMSWNWIFISF